jgi:acetyl-CoA carboxylase carboxyltransferase component
MSEAISTLLGLQAEIAVVGAEAAVNLLYRKELKDDKDGTRFKGLVSEFRERFANPYIASQEGYIDDVIMPSETRDVLIKTLSVQKNKRVERPRRKHGNIPL